MSRARRAPTSLDSDAASRAASQARIYSELGFQQRALVEGWQAVDRDPSNFSAHRFLADSYSVLPRHEIARVSELLQSQMLQPVNNTAIQPRLAESNLGLISAGGPGALSFNEFNPLFNRDGMTFQANALVGDNNTTAGEAVVGGLFGKASFSAGYSDYKTDGWRTNADQDSKIGNAFVQLDLTPQTSVQGEYRYRNVETGDTQLRFYPQDYFPGTRHTEERDTVRLGARHAFGPDSILLGSIQYSKVEFKLFDDKLAPPVTYYQEKRPEEAKSIELQHLFRSHYFNLTSGGGYFNVNGESRTEVGLALPPPLGPVLAFPPESTNLEQSNLYVYSYLKPVQNVTFTVGLSAEHVRGAALDIGNIDQYNPKFGVMWNPFPGTTVRAATFRILKRTLVTDQTLEPTQVAGFNQFYDDANGTDAWRQGVAVDQKFRADLFGGLEFSKRDVKIRYTDLSGAIPTAAKADNNSEDLARAYMFWTPHKWVALRADYIYERFQYDEKLQTDFPSDIKTHRLPLGVNFFHPSGFSAAFTATYWRQEIEKLPPFFLTDPPQRSGTEKFWTMDASVSYRLPNRHGFVSVGATNLADEKFNYYETDLKNPHLIPGRTIFARVTLALP